MAGSNNEGNNGKIANFLKPGNGEWGKRALFTAVGLIFGAGVAYGVMHTQIEDLRSCSDKHEERLLDVERKWSTAETEVQNTYTHIEGLRTDIRELRLEIRELRREIR